MTAKEWRNWYDSLPSFEAEQEDRLEECIGDLAACEKERGKAIEAARDNHDSYGAMEARSEMFSRIVSAVALALGLTIEESTHNLGERVAAVVKERDDALIKVSEERQSADIACSAAAKSVDRAPALKERNEGVLN